MFASSLPAASLRECVRYYYETRADLADKAVLQPVPARSPQAIEFMFATPFEVRRHDRDAVENAHPIVLIGAQTFRRVDLVMHGSIEAFTIVFQPAGLFRLFSIPGRDLTNNHFEATSALGNELSRLHQRLGDVHSFDERVVVANQHLGTLRPVPHGMSAIASAARQLLSTNGRVRVPVLAEKAGLGIRQFERRFRYEIGVPTKTYSRIVRFESALRHKSSAPETSWTEIAHGLGYYDQMHMVHDFDQLSGDSPMKIASQLDMFVRPEMLCYDELKGGGA